MGFADIDNVEDVVRLRVLEALIDHLFEHTLKDWGNDDDDLWHALTYASLSLQERLDQWFEERTRQPARRTAKRYIPAATKWAVFKRDGFKCCHCGADEHLSVDHIIPESAGGSDELDNLQTLCRSCNSRKGARS